MTIAQIDRTWEQLMALTDEGRAMRKQCGMGSNYSRVARYHMRRGRPPNLTIKIRWLKKLGTDLGFEQPYTRRDMAEFGAWLLKYNTNGAAARELGMEYLLEKWAALKNH